MKRKKNSGAQKRRPHRSPHNLFILIHEEYDTPLS